MKESTYMLDRSANLADLTQPGFTIIVKLKLDAETKSSGTDQVGSSVHLEDILHNKFSESRVEPLFCIDALNGLQKNLLTKGRQDSFMKAGLPAYYRIQSPTTTDARFLLKWLRGQREVDLAYFPERVGSTTSITFNKLTGTVTRKILPWQQRMNIAYARKLNGGTGKGNVRFIDVEQGWDLENAELRSNFLPSTGINLQESGAHGRAVLEIIQSQNQGIAPGARGYLISQWRPDGIPNAADAILAAICAAEPGDILLLEIQSYCADTNNLLWPIEIQPACYDAIRLASDLGIIVMEAAGNGDASTGRGNDLDNFTMFGKKPLNRNSIDFKDSGAVMVAASLNQEPYRRLLSSNYGSRIDCFAPGDRISARDLESKQVSPAMRLKGTSPAAAIMAGTAVLIQSIAEGHGIPKLDPNTMRSILANPDYGTGSSHAEQDPKIGVMPNLEKIINQHLHLFPE